MRREIGSTKEKSVGFLMAGGVTVTITSFVLFVVFLVASIFGGQVASRFPAFASILKLFPLTIIGVALGVLMMVGGLAFGFYAHSTERSGPRKSAANFRILSRYCYDRTHQLLSDDFDIEVADKPKFYVRGMLDNGMVGEFETTIEVFYQAGEGMYGEAEIQGKWMGRFIPYIGNPQDTAVYTAEHPAG